MTNEYMKRWWKEHPDKKKEYDRQFYERHRVTIRQKQQAKRKADPDKVKKQNSKYRETYRTWEKSHPENIHQKKMRYKLHHPDRIKEQERKYRENNTTKILIKNHRQRAYRIQAEGHFTVNEWEDLKRICDYRCLHCGKNEPEIKLTVDHIIPISKGGTNFITNIQPLCKSCNSKKIDKFPQELGGCYDAVEMDGNAG